MTGSENGGAEGRRGGAHAAGRRHPAGGHAAERASKRRGHAGGAAAERTCTHSGDPGRNARTRRRTASRTLANARLMWTKGPRDVFSAPPEDPSSWRGP